MKDYLLNTFASSGDLTLEAVLTRMAAAFAVAVFIFISYAISHAGTIYSRKFNVSLVTLTMITTTVMVVIGNNIALSLGMVGALSIVRFRTAVKDSRDTTYIFWAIAVGICCGAGDYRVAAIGSAFIFAVILLFGRIKGDGRMLLIVRAARQASDQVESLIFSHCAGKAVLRTKNATPEAVEYVYELSRRRLEARRRTQGDLADAMLAIEGVEYFSIVAQDDDISA